MGIGQNHRHFHEQNRRFQSISIDFMGWSLLSSSVTSTPLGANPPWVLHFDLSARFHAGDCDAGCTALAELLGWDKDLQALIDSKGQASVYRAPWVEASET